MNGEREKFYILSWSRKDIKVDGVDLATMVGRKTPGVRIVTKDFEMLQKMELKDLNRCLIPNSVLIISSAEKAENMHSWKLGFIMGRLYKYSEKDKENIIGFGDRTSFEELGGLLSICESENRIKKDIIYLVEDLYSISHGDYAAGKTGAGMEGS